jgi:hypothetical protein
MDLTLHQFRLSPTPLDSGSTATMTPGVCPGVNENAPSRELEIPNHNGISSQPLPQLLPLPPSYGWATGVRMYILPITAAGTSTLILRQPVISRYYHTNLVSTAGLHLAGPPSPASKKNPLHSTKIAIIRYLFCLPYRVKIDLHQAEPSQSLHR